MNTKQLKKHLFTVRVENWAKFNTNQKKYHIMAMVSVGFLRDEVISKLNQSEVLVYLYFILRSAEVGSEFVQSTPEVISMYTRSRVDLIRKYILNLQELGLLTVTQGHELFESEPQRREEKRREEKRKEEITADPMDQKKPMERKSLAGAPDVPTDKTLGAEIWDAYSEAFLKRYAVSPKPNAKMRTQCKRIGDLIGRDAIEVMKFYLSHNDGWYLKTQHALGNVEKQYQSLHTQWQRGKAVTSSQVRQFENQSTNMDLLEKVRRGEV